jgi:transcriptional regulator with XRE-family HTH domain
MTVQDTLPQRLQRARSRAGLSLWKAADLLRTPSSRLAAAEAGHAELSHAELGRVANYYGVSAAWLVCGTRSPVEVARGLERLPTGDREKLLELLASLPTSQDP